MKPSHNIDPQRIKRYFERDQLARALGIELVDVSPGRATARMTIREQHYNAVRIAHGGAIFTLADLAFAAASNSHGQLALGINATISYVKAASEGTLTAVAEEVSLTPKLATYAIRITDDAGEAVAIFQGTVYRKRDLIHLPEEGSA